MSNHLHLIAQANEGADLIAIIGDFKKYTARQIIDQIQESGKESRKEWLLYQMQWFARKNRRKQEYQLWQSDNHPEVLISPKFIYQKLGYIHYANPGLNPKEKFAIGKKGMPRFGPLGPISL